MSMMIGAHVVASPFYGEEGWERVHQRTGGDWQYLDGSRGRHHVTAQWRWSVVWRVYGEEYAELMVALESMAGGYAIVTDHLGHSEECMLDGDVRDRLIGTNVHEVSASFIQITV